VAAVIAASAILIAVFLPGIRQFFDNTGTYGYLEKDLKNVDNIILLTHCAEVEGQRNSVAGFKESVRQGADAVVVDICFKADGTPVITGNYADVDSAPLLENLFSAMNEEKYREIKVFLNIVQLSGFSELNKLVVDYGLVSRLTIIGIDEAHYGLVNASDTIVPIFLNYRITAEDRSAIDNGTFEAPTLLDEYGAAGLVIDYSDCSEKVITALGDYGISTVVESVDTNARFCSALSDNAQIVYVNDVEKSRAILDKWITAMQERYQSSVEKSLEELSEKSE